MEELYAKGWPDTFDVFSGNTKIGVCYYEDESALPFIISNGKIYYGKNGDGHWSIGYDLIGTSQEEIDDLDSFTEIERIEKKRDDAVWELRKDKNYISGRIWSPMYTYKNIKLPFELSVISFWGFDGKTDKKIDGSLIRQIIDYVGADENNVLVVKFNDNHDSNGYGKIYNYTDWDFYVPKMSDSQKDVYAVHLMKSKDKHDATADFRTNRDRKIGQKLTNDKGVEMPIAQYRNMIYSENINRIIKNVLKEYIDKNVKRIIF